MTINAKLSPCHADLYPCVCLVILHAAPGWAVCDDGLSLWPQPSPHTHTFAQTAVGVGSPESTLGSESILLVPVSWASFCVALGHGRCFAAPLRTRKEEAREGFKNKPLLSPLLRISSTCTSVPPLPKQGLAHQEEKKKKCNRENGKWEQSSRESQGHGLAEQGRASHAMLPRAPRLTSPPTRFHWHRQGPRCLCCHHAKAYYPHACPSCSLPIPAQSMPRQTGIGLQPGAAFF